MLQVLILTFYFVGDGGKGGNRKRKGDNSKE